MANSSHCLLTVVGPSEQVQRFLDALSAPERGDPTELEVFEHPLSSAILPFFHRIYHYEILAHHDGPNAVNEGCIEDWEDLNHWEYNPRFAAHGGEVLLEAACVPEGSAVAMVEIEFRLVPPPGVLYLAKMFPDCRWRMQAGFEGHASDWFDSQEVAEVRAADIDWTPPDHAVIDARFAFDSNWLHEEMRIGATVDSQGVSNGLVIERRVPIESCQRVLVPVTGIGGVMLAISPKWPAKRDADWVAPSRLTEPPARALLFDLSAAACRSPDVLTMDAHLGTATLDYREESSDAGWRDISELTSSDYVPYRFTQVTRIEFSEDFASSCDDFVELVSRNLPASAGEVQTFRENAAGLSAVITQGACRVFSILCENEDYTIDIELRPDSIRIR